MKYLKIATTFLLILAFAANVSFAAGVKKAGRVQLGQRQTEQLNKGVAKAHRAITTSVDKKEVKSEGQTADEAVMSAGSTIQLTKTNRQIPAEILAGGLSGTFHIGAANQFKNFADIAFLLNIANVSGPVTFLLDDATYTEAGVAIGASNGASATNLITIQPAAGNTNCVVTLADNGTNGGGLVFDGATYITVNGTAVGEATGSRNLSIALSGYPVSSYSEAPVRIWNGSNITIENAIITGNHGANAWGSGNGSVSIYGKSGGFNDAITVDNCELHGGHYGVIEKGNYLLNDADWGVAQDFSTTVSNCYVHDVYENGINLQQVTGAVVSHNLVKRVVMPSGFSASPNLLSTGGSTPPSTAGANLANYPLIYRLSGITVWGDYALIDNNLVDSCYMVRTTASTFGAQAFGIRIIGFGNNDPDPEFGGGLSLAGYVTGSMIKNNIVTRIFSSATQNNSMRWNAVGIKGESGRWDTLVHNTVYLSGAGLGTSGTGKSATALLLEGVTTTPPSVFGGNAGFPVWTLGQSGPDLFSYRVIAKDNIFAVDRTNSGTDNCVLAIQNATSPAGFVSDYRTPSDYNVLYMGATGEVARDSRGNVYTGLLDFQAGNPTAGVDVHSQGNSPTLTSESDAHINPAGKSTADGTGIAYPGTDYDYDGVLRGNPPDIGALEGTGAGLPHDIKTISLVNPGGAGVPAGLPFSGFEVKVINLSGFAETGVAVNIHILAPDSLSFVDFPGTFDLAAGASATVSVPGTWTPSAAGSYSYTVTVTPSVDDYPANNTITGSLPVAGQATLPYTSGFENPTELSGWFGDGDFGLGTTGGKLGGPHAGTAYYVTRPGTAGNGYTDANLSMLYSPYFDLSAVSSATLSMYHSINTEPSWDRSIIQYTLDTGKTWKTLGVLNDPNGINWYSTAVYQNAAGNEADCWDEATATAKGFPSDNPGVMPPAQFSTNGDCLNDSPNLTRSPNGYVLIAYKFDSMPAETTPLGHSFVRFRYVTFADAGTHGDGWAIDDFAINAGVSSSPAAFSGKIYNDVDGNGAFDGADAGLAGVNVSLTYFGAVKVSTTTDANGDYNFPNTDATTGMYLPGVYTVTTDYTGGAKSQSAGDHSYTGNGAAVTGANVGYYNGSISGQVFNDVNNNNTNDSEPGFSGFVVEVRHDKATGALIGSVTTDATGNWSVQCLPDTYYVKVTAPTNQFRQTLPESTYSVIVSGNGGSPTASVTGKDFGFFKTATLRVTATIDQNGNGTADPTDIAVLPPGVFAAFTLSKGETVIRVDTIGSGTKEYAVSGIDTGSYTISFNAGAPAQANFMLTNAVSSYNVTVATSALLDTTRYLFYKYATVAGTVYNDVDGNGTKDGGDNGVSGVSITVDGNPAATTDSNGTYSVGGLHPGAHTVAAVLPSGKEFTTVSSYNFTPNSGTTTANKNFGSFEQFTISGTTYRDRDFNGAQNGADNAISDVVVSLTKNGNPAGSANSDGSGNYSFTALGPGAYVVSAAAPSGYIQTQPATTYEVTGASATNSTGNAFGFFRQGDSLKFRTLTAEDLFGNGTKKPAKNAKADTVANLANLANDQIANFAVGVVGTSKATAWFQPKKYSDVFKSVGADGKSPAHSGTPGGFDFTAKGKVMGGRYAAIPSTIQDNVLFANLLALNLNLAASDNNGSPAGLGSLVINDGGPFDGMTINAFTDSANYVMSYWRKIPQSTYDAMNSLAAAINGAFNSPFSYDAPSYRSTGKVFMPGVKTVYEVSWLLPAVSNAPKIHRYGQTEEAAIPTVYALYQNYPNPFNPTTNIRFDLPMSSVVTVKIYNMLGQEVATLFNHESMDAGVVETQFNAASLSSGVYFYRVSAEGQNADGISTGETFSKVMKMALVK